MMKKSVTNCGKRYAWQWMLSTEENGEYPTNIYTMIYICREVSDYPTCIPTEC
jgi:hypothetical protein